MRQMALIYTVAAVVFCPVVMAAHAGPGKRLAKNHTAGKHYARHHHHHHGKHHKVA